MNKLKGIMGSNRSVILAYCFAHIWVILSIISTMNRLGGLDSITSIYGISAIMILTLLLGIAMDILNRNAYAAVIGIILCQFCSTYSILGNFIGYGAILGIVAFECGVALDIPQVSSDIKETRISIIVFNIFGILGYIVANLNIQQKIQDWMLITSTVIILIFGLIREQNLKSTNKKYKISVRICIYALLNIIAAVVLSGLTLFILNTKYLIAIHILITILGVVLHKIVLKKRDIAWGLTVGALASGCILGIWLA